MTRILTAASEGAATGGTPGPGWLETSWRAFVLFFAYVTAGYVAGTLLRQQHVASPVCLHAGLALGVMLAWGRGLAPVIGLAHIALFLLVSLDSGGRSLGGAAGFGLGALLQALIGSSLLLRLLGPSPPRLSTGRDILVFVLAGGLLTPGIGALIGTATLYQAYGVSDPRQLQGIALDLWLGNVIGVLTATPITLALIGKPAEVWQPRRLNTALPLAIMTVLLALLIFTLPQWDLERQRALQRFHEDSAQMARRIEARLEGALGVLSTTRGLLALRPGLDLGSLRAAAPRLLASQGDAIDLLAVATTSGLRVLNGSLDAAPPPDELAAWLDMPADQARVSPAYAPRVGGQPLHAMLYQAPAARLENEPAVLLTVDLHRLVQQAQAGMPGEAVACLVDAGIGRALLGPPGCEAGPADKASALVPQEFSQLIAFADRQWRLRIRPTEDLLRHASPRAQLVTSLAALSLGLVATLLLVYSARTRTAEALAGQRQAQLLQSSRELRRNEQRFRGVFQHAQVGVCISALDGRPLTANAQFCRLLGCTPSELPLRYEDFVAEDARLAARLAEQAQASLQLQRSYRHADGSQRRAQLTLSLQRAPDGKPEALLCIAQDVTDQLCLEANERARAAAELANRAKSEFLSRMSHELRTPLNGLLGFTQLLQLEKAALTRTQGDWIDRIGQAGWQLLHMIDNVLDLSRAETGHLKLSLETQDAHSLCDEALALLSGLAARRGIRVTASLAPEARYLRGDTARVRQILCHLLSNAIKYNAAHGQVVLAALPAPDGFVEITVSDTGPGLSAAQLAGLFQPFNRLGQEYGSITGTGMGLVTARRLAEMMGGTLELSSQPGQGTVATLRMPAAAAPGSNSAFASTQPMAEPGSGSAPAAPRRRRVVYVEDNPVNIEVMRAVIAQRSQVDLAVYEDGASGLAALLADPPELLLLDMQLPDTDGLTLLRALRRAPQCATLEVVILSADTLDAQVREAHEAGARHYLGKPFDLRELLGLLDRLLAQ